MTLRKYRLCIFLLIIVVMACGIFLVYQAQKEKEEYEDGILVERDCADWGEEMEQWG